MTSSRPHPQEIEIMSNKFARHFFIILCLCLSSFGALAQSQETSSASNLPPITVNVRQYTFFLKPGGSFTFSLPKVASPIRIEISFPSTNAGVQTPSELMWALVNLDSDSHNITWIGSNSDGSALGSNSLTGSGIIANIYGGSAPTTIASLIVANASAGTLSVTQSSTTTSITGKYIVREYF
jgi:hypothetical protein